MITNINPLSLIDGYKADHRRQYPPGTEFIYSNLTARKSRVDGVEYIIFFGLQYLLKEYLIDRWNQEFFHQPKYRVVADYTRTMKNYLGNENVSYEHVADLHDLGYLPVFIKALPEGTKVPIGVPCLTIINTKEKFFWVTNYLETLLSNIMWKPTTSATTAYVFRKEMERHCALTGYNRAFIDWQGHDFSFRGTSGNEDAFMSGAGHLLSFTGTDTIPTIDFMERYYDADSDIELIGASVPATEHSVMCMGEKENEIETFRRLIHDLYPTGIVSIVSDTWDFGKVLTEYIPELKDEIMARDGRVVIRPDSGDPVDIICGYPVLKDGMYPKGFSRGEIYELGDPPRFLYEGILYELNKDMLYENEAEYGKTSEFIMSEYLTIIEDEEDWVMRGAYETLWDIFGGTTNSKGFKELDDHIGLIYGDSITRERQIEILRKLEAKGFSASNLVFGIGSFTYEYVTRDTYGFAMKATWGQVNGEGRDIFKDPKTDSGFKKSAKGLLSVRHEDGGLVLKQQCTREEEKEGLLLPVFQDGVLLSPTSLEVIRRIVRLELNNDMK